MPKETIVISVGGSLIVPNDIDRKFLKKFKSLIEKQVKKGRRFVIVSGGGKTARHYQEAADDVGKLTPDDIDWIGIHSCRLNAHLLRTIFREIARPVIIKDPNHPVRDTHPVIIGTGWKPGRSSDYVAVRIAKTLGAHKLINLTNIDYVYDKDPRKYKSAKPLKEVSWHEFRKVIPKKWDPGIHTPFDPVAAKESERMRLEVAIINGLKLERLEQYLNGKAIPATIIR